MIKIDRKTFIRTTSLASAGILITPRFISHQNTPRIRAIVFDAFVIFDTRPIFKAVQELFPEKAKQIIDTWQSRQFTYQWLRVLGNRYKNFLDVTNDALDFALLQSGLDNHEKERELIMTKYESIQVWPDVIPALETIKKDGLAVCFLSNMTEKMLNQGIQNSNLEQFFDLVISTDRRETYKPSQSAYQLAVDQLKIRREEILFAPFAAWDMVGAKWFGYPTFWVNRLNASSEELDAEPDGQGSNLDDLVAFIGKM